jgi:ceramide glucosyltransferase
MFQHEVRWHRSERACRPFDQFMAVITWPLALLLLLLLPQPSIVGLSIIGAHITLRIVLHFLVRRHFRIATPPEPWLVPLRECVCFFAWVAGMFGNNIKWGKETFSIRAYRKLMAAESAPLGGTASASQSAKASRSAQ